MKRPPLNEISVQEAINTMTLPGAGIVTVSPGQWDVLLEALYNDDFILLELNEKEEPIRAYRKFQQ